MKNYTEHREREVKKLEANIFSTVAADIFAKLKAGEQRKSERHFMKYHDKHLDAGSNPLMKFDTQRTMKLHVANASRNKDPTAMNGIRNLNS